jgi:hypothetical protein
MGLSLEQIKRGSLEVEMRRAGFTPRRDWSGNVTWLPPDHPANPGVSSFTAWEPGEREALAPEGAPDRIVPTDEAEAKFDMDAVLKRLDAIEQQVSAVSKKDDAA